MAAMTGAEAVAAGWFEDLWRQAVVIWATGGWAMAPIALTAAVMFGVGASLWWRGRATGFHSVPEKVWRLWIDHPKYREGRIGELIGVAVGARTLPESTATFAGIRAAELAPFRRDLRLMKVGVAAGPLLGLLGTVTGMLSTFGALGSGAGGDQTMAAVAQGISEALITTEAGLVVALPGMFFHYLMARTRDRYAAFLTHLETVCTQNLYRRLRAGRAA
jgi:biopolymer transport protein ExbB